MSRRTADERAPELGPEELPQSQPAAAGEGGRAETLRVVRDPNFAPYFVGNLVSNSGTWFQTLAQSLLVFRLTHSTFLLGVVNFAQFAGVFLLAPWAGSAADRFDRRRLLIVTQLAASALTALLALLAWIGAVNAAIVIGIVLLIGLTVAFGTPAMQALVASLVPRERLGAAVALNSVTFNVARAVGPALGALVVATLGIPVAFALNACSYLVLVAALGRVRARTAQIVSTERPRLRDSIATVRRSARLAILLAIVAVAGVSVDPVTTLSPAYATRIFGTSDTLAGYLIGAFGAGAVTAAFTIAGRGRSRRRVALTLALLGGGLVGFAVSPSPAVAFAVLVVAGFGYLGTNTAATTVIHLETSDAERGRMMALWSIAFIGSRPLASLVDGALASAFGVRAATLVLSAPALLAAAGMLARARRIERRSEHPPSG